MIIIFSFKYESLYAIGTTQVLNYPSSLGLIVVHKPQIQIALDTTIP